MAFPILYINTGGHAQGSGSTDSSLPTVSNTSGASVSGSTVTLSGMTGLLGSIPTDGSATIYLADATNSNQLIFKITSVNDGAGSVDVETAPTGTISNSAWGIGGQFVLAPARYEGAMKPGWIAEFGNSPAAGTALLVTARVAGDGTNGMVKWRGKAGTRPVLNITNTAEVMSTNSLYGIIFENLELDQDGASGNVCRLSGNNNTAYNIKVSDGGAIAFLCTGEGARVIGCEATGVGSKGVQFNGRSVLAGCYIHDITTVGVNPATGQIGTSIINNIFDTCGAQGIYYDTAVSGGVGGPVMVNGNTIYGCGNSGLEVADIDTNMALMNNIFMNNGNASGEYNVEWAAGAAEYTSFHGWNLFYQDATTLATGAANLSGLTVNAQVSGSELTSDPLFVDAPNGDFRIGSISPAKATGFPGQFLGGPLGYLDMGAVQRAEHTARAQSMIGF